MVLAPKIVLRASKIAFHPKLGQSLGQDVAISKTSLLSQHAFVRSSFHLGFPLPGPLYPARPKLPLGQEILKLCLPLVITALETVNLLHGLGEQQEFPLEAPRTLKVQTGGSGVQGQSWLHRESKPTLGSMRLLIKIMIMTMITIINDSHEINL